MFARDAVLATQLDTGHLPVKGEANAKAKTKARARGARATGRHGNVKNLDALTHRNCVDTASYALRALRTSALIERTLKSSLKMKLH